LKTDRLRKILEIIKANKVETQEELTRLLREAGFNITQGTVSRDIRDLRLTKTAARGGRFFYTVPSETVDADIILTQGIISMELSLNILVIKTRAGMAMAVAASIDSIKDTGIIGTIAGDDTIFCALRSENAGRAALGKIRNATGGGF